MFRKMIAGAALTLVLLAGAGCSEISAVETALNLTVPSNVSQGAADLSTIASGLESVLGTIGQSNPTVASALAQMQTVSAQVATATSTETAAPLLQQFETAFNAAVAAEATNTALPAVAQLALQAATIALPLVEALIPLPASTTTAPAAMMAATAPKAFTSPQQALDYLRDASAK